MGASLLVATCRNGTYINPKLAANNHSSLAACHRSFTPLLGRLFGAMQHVGGMLLLTLVSSCYCATLNSARRQRSTSGAMSANRDSVRDVHSRVYGQNFTSVAKKPLLPAAGVGGMSDVDASRNSPQRLLHVATAINRKKTLPPHSPSSVGSHSQSKKAGCFPRLYRLTLLNGNCSHSQITKVFMTVSMEPFV